MDIAANDFGTSTKRAATFGSLVDKWIFVFMAGWFIAIVLAGFVPDSLMKVAAVQSGQRPPFPPILHLHAMLMGSFLTLLLTQAWLVATGKTRLHMQLGVAAFLLVPALVVVGFMLVPQMGQQLQAQLAIAPPEARARIEAILLRRENIALVQIRVGILFPLLVGIALAARRHDSGLHKRLMILATSATLSAGIGRITWLPSTLPSSYLTSEVYTLLALAPMLIWDVVRNGALHRAYVIWAACTLPVATAMHLLWDTPFWHGIARQLLAA